MKGEVSGRTSLLVGVSIKRVRVTFSRPEHQAAPEPSVGAVGSLITAAFEAADRRQRGKE